MNQIDLTALLTAILPALVIGALAYYFFKSFLQNEQYRRSFLLKKDNQRTALPIRLQAYERMGLFLERISPGSLLFRVKPTDDDPQLFASLLIQTIEQEFEHNIAQQIYLSQDCWDYIKTAKNATIAMIRKLSQMDEVTSADNLREQILKHLMDKPSPTDAALAFMKTEVRKNF
ncbi:DUF7935 family protein [Salegentibacter sp. HM20]